MEWMIALWCFCLLSEKYKMLLGKYTPTSKMSPTYLTYIRIKQSLNARILHYSSRKVGWTIDILSYFHISQSLEASIVSSWKIPIQLCWFITLQLVHNFLPMQLYIPNQCSGICPLWYSSKSPLFFQSYDSWCWMSSWRLEEHMDAHILFAEVIH